MVPLAPIRLSAATTTMWVAFQSERGVNKPEPPPMVQDVGLSSLKDPAAATQVALPVLASPWAEVTSMVHAVRCWRSRHGE